MVKQICPKIRQSCFGAANIWDAARYRDQNIPELSDWFSNGARDQLIMNHNY
jgi:hypothetical protein